MIDFLKVQMVRMDATWVYYIFYLGLLFAIVAQVLAYYHGPRTRWRFIGMVFGIGAVCLIAIAGQITNVKLRDYANFIAGRTMGGGL